MEALLNLMIPTVSAGLACLGFTYIFNVHGMGRLICSMGGSLGWLIYQLGDKSILAAFLAAAAIAVYSEMMARLVRCPATGYLLVSLLPLVPGGGIYYAMSYCVQGERELFLQTLLNTFGMAATLAVGSMLASSLFRTLFPRFPHILPKIRK